MTRPTSCTGCVYDRPELYQHGALCLHPEAHRTAWWYEDRERGVEKCYTLPAPLPLSAPQTCAPQGTIREEP